MKLHIENFAKIANADIEINGITVIAGENGTGKSTVSKVLYSTFDTFFELEKKLNSIKINALSRRLERYLDFQDDLFSFKKVREVIREIVHHIIDQFNIDMTLEEYENKLCTIIKDLGATIHDMDDYAKYSYEILSTKKIEEIETFLANNILREIGSISSLYTKKYMSVNLQIQNDCIHFTYHQHDDEFNVYKYIPLSKQAIYYDDPNVIDYLNRSFHIMQSRLNYLDHNEKLSFLLRNDVQNTNMYEEIVNRKNLQTLQEELKEIVNGDFIEEDDEIKFKSSDLEDGFKLQSLSSGLKGMSVLLRLIECGKLEEKGTIILDEPEIHLHPKWQLNYAEMLVKLQKILNLHILVSTHSPYFINAIEVYSAKYEIADKCKYYLSNLNDSNMVIFEDVTRNTEKIFQKLAEPFQELADLEAEVMEND